jgi:hypothetical protein
MNSGSIEILFNVAALGVSAYGVVRLGNWLHDYLHPNDRGDSVASKDIGQRTSPGSYPSSSPRTYQTPSFHKPDWL